MKNLEKTAFGGGCFWCTEAVFLQLRGVARVTPGYAGGRTANPNYAQVSSGKTGHAEVILIEYDPKIISFSNLLGVFFASHDPTTINRQGNDAGEQYRSIILYSTDIQKIESEEYITKLVKKNTFQNPIVTQVESLAKFYPAEEYHKNYYALHKDEPYSQAVIAPKMEKIRKEYSELLKS